LTPDIREIRYFDPLSSQIVAIIALVLGTHDVFSTILGRRGPKLLFLLIREQNRNILKLRGRKVQFSLFLINKNAENWQVPVFYNGGIVDFKINGANRQVRHQRKVTQRATSAKMHSQLILEVF
jgi:hypothetical protein